MQQSSTATNGDDNCPFMRPIRLSGVRGQHVIKNEIEEEDRKRDLLPPACNST